MEFTHYWKLILEICILWYVIYMLLLFIKGTRTEQLLKGLLILAIIFLITQQLKLEAINWVLTRLFPISVVGLFIIFQPEMRNALALLGQLGTHQKNIEVIDEIARAAAILAKQKIGALIVIEREVGLKSYIESGISIYGKVTNYLITSIFMPQTVLHDGAVIIQRGLLVAAGCTLPLSQDDKSIPKYLGMRHRAALGISEETDAVCVVVSEETGIISIASKARLIRHLDEESLAATLKTMFNRQEKSRKRFGLIAKKDRINTI